MHYEVKRAHERAPSATSSDRQLYGWRRLNSRVRVVRRFIREHVNVGGGDGDGGIVYRKSEEQTTNK